MNRFILLLFSILLIASACNQTESSKEVHFSDLAPTPPMGWNSYDAYHGAITEEQYKACVDVLAEKMLPHGYDYAVIDFCWYHPGPKGWDPENWKTFFLALRPDNEGNVAQLAMDEYGRVLPAENRFPSAANGQGFKPLADYTHDKGMKFGIHLMRGIPRQAVERKLPILGTEYTAADVAEPFDTCPWMNHMYGVDYRKPGAQEYYNSLFDLYAKWEVDYVKVDDLTQRYYHEKEVEMIRKAIDQCGRPMVLSISPGESPLGMAEHFKENVNMWRISADFWDNWEDLYHNFHLLDAWSPHIGNGTWPDADMIPIGRLCLSGYPGAHVTKNHPKQEHDSRFTADEKQTLMTLWCIARSPLMWGGDPLSLDAETEALLTNDEVLEMLSNTENNRQLYFQFRGDEDLVIWMADIPFSNDKYLAFFNRGDTGTADMYFDFNWEHMKGRYEFRNLWSKTDVGTFENRFDTRINPHASELYKLTFVE